MFVQVQQTGMAMTDLLKDYIPRKTLAEQIGYTEKTLINWELDGKGPPATRVGRQVLYRRASVEKWLQAQERATKAA
jgi:predicted DNA-binding transcriptional regulator AlpA